MRNYRRNRKLIPVILLFLSVSHLQAGEILRFLSWNIEGNDSNPFLISYQISQMEGFDLFGLCEVNPGDVYWLAEAAAFGEGQNSQTPRFNHFAGSTGGSIRLMLIWDDHRLTPGDDGIIELHHLSQGNHRAPLAGHFVSRITGEQFYVVVNHLARGDEALRERQSLGLKEWAIERRHPVFFIGDFNFDYNLDTGTGNSAFNLFIEDDIIQWEAPSAEDLEPTYISNSYFSILDFVFTYNIPDNWNISTRVLHLNQSSDSPETSDHRPIKAVVQIP